MPDSDGKTELMSPTAVVVPTVEAARFRIFETTPGVAMTGCTYDFRGSVYNIEERRLRKVSIWKMRRVP